MADDAAAAPQPQKRKLRERTRKFYTDDWTFGDEEFEGRRVFSVEEKIESDKYDLKNFAGLYREITGPELTVKYIQKHGFSIPLLVREKTGLGIRVPSQNFTVNDVRTCVGSRRVLDVMDVNTQLAEEMSMKEWQKYYDDPNKSRLLNVISLEFSHTKLANYVQSPSIVRQLDWVDTVWPKHLKDSQVESTNSLEDMMYPKVQKYCLMSVKGCYTDFHVDFGGTSVWYHILKGAKIFWLIPPTEKNMALYLKWVLSGKQSDVFFGDMVDHCGRITLSEGMTFFIPTGWIHAVFTPADSLVFGGNFLHSFGIDKQLKVAQVEETTKVPHKFRYPFLTEMLWYVLEKYVHVLLGRSHLDSNNSESETKKEPKNPEEIKHVHLTPLELHGLKSIVMYLHSLPSSKKNVPELISDPVALIHDVRCLVEQHRHDSHELAITGVPVLPPPPSMSIMDGEKMSYRKKLIRPPLKERSNSAAPRRRRTRCKKCEACTRTDCGECCYCQDMVKFGGTGRAKQTCLMRQCMRPNLPVTAACKFCNMDGWGQTPAPLTGKQGPLVPSTLMECSICFDIVHPECTGKNVQDMVVSDDLPNSWECPECCESGRNLNVKIRPGVKARSRKISLSNAVLSAQATDSEKAMTPCKKFKSENNESWSDDQEPAEGHQRTIIIQNQTPVQNSSPKKQFAVATRPLQVVPLHRSNENFDQPHVLNKTVIVSIFKYLSPKDIASCACVCKTWERYSLDPSLWKTIELSHSVLTATHLTGIIQRQPEKLILDWTNIAKRQLAWLLSRLSHLQTLSLKGCSWTGVSALNTYACPPLVSLDLSFVTELNDSNLREILVPPNDSRPGLIDKSSRLKYLRSLSLCSCDISDVSLRYIAQHLSYIEVLNLSSCSRITDAGVAQLTSPPATTITTLVSLNLSGCRLVSDTSLDHLMKCQALKNLDLRNSSQITRQKVSNFSKTNGMTLLYSSTRNVENLNGREST